MGLDMRMIALGGMGYTADECMWRGNFPLLQLARMFGGPEPDCFEDGSNPIVLDSDALKCIARFLADPILSLHLWGEVGDAEYYDSVILSIAEDFQEAHDFSEKECIEYYFYASY